MWNVAEYLRGHSAKAIKVGQSGADVYEIDGKYVLKHVVRERLEAGQFDTYTREALFYQHQMKRRSIYLPEVLEAEASENEMVILMKKYDRPARDEMDAALLQGIARTLAALHTDAVPPFLCAEQGTAERLSAPTITECLGGWNSVLAEHPGSFQKKPLEGIADSINDLMSWHDAEERVLSHGDFHWDNLLKDNHGAILLCDWQGVHLSGASGDLSFFLSRLDGDGVHLGAEKLLDAYVQAIRELSGKGVERQEILRHMSAANVITSFMFWHQYLHGSSEDRVRSIYGRMIRDFEVCCP